MANNNEIKYEIREHICVLNRSEGSGWRKEANIVSWNGGVPKLDIRDWSPDHERMTRGVTLHEAEAKALAKALAAKYTTSI